jgi:hypothetical protein
MILPGNPLPQNLQYSNSDINKMNYNSFFHLYNINIV